MGDNLSKGILFRCFCSLTFAESSDIKTTYAYLNYEIISFARSA